MSKDSLEFSRNNLLCKNEKICVTHELTTEEQWKERSFAIAAAKASLPYDSA